jgi:peptidoglycan/xylan/chitin deacetylase (PgdA/CDA1 family)
VFIEQPPQLVRALYPGALWRMNPHEKKVYLTFDDGPIPEITPWVLDLLDKYNIKATFFLVMYGNILKSFKCCWIEDIG